MLLNGCLDRRDIDLAISAYLGRQKKSSFFPIKTMKGGTLWQIKKHEKASTVIGAGFCVFGLI